MCQELRSLGDAIADAAHRRRFLLGPFGTVEDVASATAVLASDDSSYISGLMLVIDQE